MRCAGGRSSLRGAAVVVHVDDQAVPDPEHLCPCVPPAHRVGPREGDDHTVAMLFERVEAVVVVTCAAAVDDR
jgi:hypothetical protein